MDPRRLSRRPPKDDDLTFLAGWMYADLFLAMMVVFLATVSFVPEYLGTAGRSNSDTYSYSEIIKTPLVLAYDGFNIDAIDADIAAFKRSIAISNDAEIIYVQAVGAYKSGTESATDAIERAQTFISKIDATSPSLLDNASTTLSSSTSIPINRIVLKLTFATKVGVSGR